ncbi:MAG TPA: hypothetical protein VLE99_03945 [Candidatus Saccharimonadales bacterium]|nr:hypothetical protein [Candidatus Saccharimonadales bacterium]
MKRLGQSGSHIIGLALLVLALGVVGYAGYKVEQAHTKTTSTTQAATTKASVPAIVTSQADLQQVSDVLDQSSAQLNTNLDDSGLNADLNSML